MTIETSTPQAGDVRGTMLEWLAGFAASLSWALEMRRRCERERVMGRPLDHAGLSRLSAEAEDRVAGR